jgi:LysM repeat protein
MSEANVEQQEIEEQPAQANHERILYANEDIIVIEEDDVRGELVKFGIVAVILLFTVLIIALLRPLIFGKIVPAVLGENQPAAPLVSSPTEAETIKPDSEEAIEEGVVEEETVEETAVPPTDDSEEAAPEPENPEDFPTAVPAQIHTVQVGETLTAIAKQYNSTVQSIVDANKISNPNSVNAGTQLIIPVDSNQ